MSLKNNSNETFCKKISYDSYRIIDANLNRSKEGLRVCEEIIRFHFENRPFSAKFNKLRHAITTVMNNSKIDQKMLFQYRNSADDIGKKFSYGLKRCSFKNIFMANSQRVKEGLRAIEEFSKLFDMRLSKDIQHLRFQYYELEKKTIKRFPSLLDSR